MSTVTHDEMNNYNTSYICPDYDAPLTECGDVTDKYRRIRTVLQTLLPDQGTDTSKVLTHVL